MNDDADFLKRLLEMFKVEAAEHLEVMSASLLELERQLPPEEAARVVEVIFREVHSMKGAARSVNLPAVERVCQALENVFAMLKRKEAGTTPQLFDVLHRSVNLLSSLVSEPSRAAEEKGAVKEVIAAIAASVAPKRGGDAETIEASPQQAPMQQQGEGTTAIPMPQMVTAETVRVAKEKLDSLLLQGETFLAVKQATAQRSAEAASVVDAAMALTRESSAIAHFRISEPASHEFHQFLDSRDARISALYHSIASLAKQLEQDRRSAGTMVDNLLESLKTVSLFPFSSLLEMMGKLVRDLSHDQGKEVRLVIRGGDLEADRRILDEMREPLIHIIRNCIDHGIEKPEERMAAGKIPTGEIRIEIAYCEGRWIQITVGDDGRGVEPARVKHSAVRLGIISAEDAERLDESGLFSLMFNSGVSASNIITDISGRGLGLAIVRERVERMGGSVRCESVEGAGTTFIILLPHSLATFRALLVKCRGRRFLIPSSAVKRTLRLPADELRRETVVTDGQVLRVTDLGAILHLPAKSATPTSSFVRIVIVGAGGTRTGLGVDEILDDQEVLVKHLGPQLVRVPNVLAATILGDGSVVPILNVADLMKAAKGAPPPAAALGEQRREVKKAILVVEDSITSRSLLKNILEASGYTVSTAVDGIEGLNALKSGEFDLVVSDVDMPRMNGFEMTEKIRSDRRLAPLPVVLVTSLQSREDQEKGIDAGANAYIVKSSFDQSNLLEVIRQLL